MRLPTNLLTVWVVAASIAPLVTHAQLGAFNSSYNFAEVTTSSGTTDPTPPPTAPGVQFSPFEAHGVSANPAAAGRFAFAGWNTSPGYDAGRYFEVSLTPETGIYLDLATLGFAVRRSGTGPRDFVVRSSLDDFTVALGTATATHPEISVSGNEFHFVNDISPTANLAGNSIALPSAFQALTESVTFRIYAANPESAAGSFTVDDLSFAGATTAVPEPETYAAFTGLALLATAAWRQRRRLAEA